MSVFSVMGLRALIHPSHCKWKTVGCRFEYHNITGALFCFVAFSHTNMRRIKLWPEHMHCTICVMHSLLHSWLAYIFSEFACVSAHVIVYLMFTSCGPVLLFVWALPHLIPVSALGSSLLEGFMPPADPEDLSRLLGHPRSPAVVLLLNTACVIHHMLSWAVRGSHDKCCVSVYETIMLASLFKPPLSSTVDCSALAKSVLWACGTIIQRPEDVSFAKSKKYAIFHYTPVLWKSLGKQQERHECN